MIESFSVDEIENTLCQVEGIKAARIVAGPDKNIEEIHILASSSKGPKQLSRDIESLLMARYGLPVNHRKISIAQINSHDVRINRARPRLVSIGYESFDRNARVRVVLSYKGQEYDGIEEGPNSRVGRLRLIASATLRAVEKIMLQSHSLALEDITAVKLGGQMAVTVLVAMVNSSGEESFVGSSVVKEDESKAIVRAVLSALNRRLGLLIT
ncbi:MAG: hypothetical protein QME63_05455 [Actinomycetota bacterium]|nr:hypothetical protein [Actinomycetota bacterium]